MNLIDKDDLLRDMRKCKAFGELSAKSAIRKVEACPTVDVEPVRHGEWIYDAEDYAWKCSSCGTVFEDEKPTHYNYCPYCGAKLDNSHCKPCDDCQEFDCYGCEYAERKEE